MGGTTAWPPAGRIKSGHPQTPAATGSQNAGGGASRCAHAGQLVLGEIPLHVVEAAASCIRAETLRKRRAQTNKSTSSQKTPSGGFLKKETDEECMICEFSQDFCGGFSLCPCSGESRRVGTRSPGSTTGLYGALCPPSGLFTRRVLPRGANLAWPEFAPFESDTGTAVPLVTPPRLACPRPCRTGHLGLCMLGWSQASGG